MYFNIHSGSCAPIPSVPKENIQTTYLPIAALAEAAAGVAPFPLPNTPDNVNGFWLFKKSAGDIPTLPTLAFQIYALDVYEDFLRLLTKVSAQKTARLPSSKEQVVVSRGITDLVLRLRELFKSSPIIGKQMLAELNNENHRPLTPSVKHTIKALINLYQSDDWQYLNFYGPARSINTISYPDAEWQSCSLASGTRNSFGCSSFGTTVYGWSSGLWQGIVRGMITLKLSGLMKRPVRLEVAA